MGERLKSILALVCLGCGDYDRVRLDQEYRSNISKCVEDLGGEGFVVVLNPRETNSLYERLMKLIALDAVTHSTVDEIWFLGDYWDESRFIKRIIADGRGKIWFENYAAEHSSLHFHLNPLIRNANYITAPNRAV